MFLPPAAPARPGRPLSCPRLKGPAALCTPSSTGSADSQGRALPLNPTLTPVCLFSDRPQSPGARPPLGHLPPTFLPQPCSESLSEQLPSQTSPLTKLPLVPQLDTALCHSPHSWRGRTPARLSQPLHLTPARLSQPLHLTPRFNSTHSLTAGPGEQPCVSSLGFRGWDVLS